MSRVKENQEFLDYTNCFMRQCANTTLDNETDKNELMNRAYKAVTAQALLDISKSLAIIADKLTPGEGGERNE